MVIADTSVWIPFFNDPESPEKREICTLIDADRLILVGVVLAELLQGCRTSKEAQTILSALAGLRYLETSFAGWKKTGEISASLRHRGITLPFSDLVIAALALEHNCHVFTLDPHFDLVPGLVLHKARRLRR